MWEKIRKRRFQFRSISSAFSSFWERNPALFLSLCLLLGTAASFHGHWLFFFFFAILCCSFAQKKILIIGFLFFLGAVLSTEWRCPKTSLSQEKIQGKGIFHIDQVKIQTSPFNRSILYKGTLVNFKTEKETYYFLPCKIYLPLFGKHPPANFDYEIKGTLSQKEDHSFVLKPEKNRIWNPISTSFNLSQWRFDTKQKISKYLKQEIPDSKVRSLLNALATGDIDERILSLEFSKVGLQHILAISGFHFALAAMFMNFILRLIFSYRISLSLLLIALTFYYFFLGNTPSIQRAYVAISFMIIGKLFSLKISGLNALGIGLLVEILFDPLIIDQLSFQLTFLCTMSILLFYPLLFQSLSFLLPERPYKDAKNLNLFEAHGYLLSAFLRRSIALTVAVHLISVPVLLFLFHKFPLISIAYNLFFPICISFSALLLFAALFFALWMPMLSHAIHSLNSLWTSAILNLVSYPPALLEFSFRTKSISFSFILCFLAITFILGVILHEKSRAKDDQPF